MATEQPAEDIRLDKDHPFAKLHSAFKAYPARESLATREHLKPGLTGRYRGWTFFVDEDKQKVPFREVDENGTVTKWNCLKEEDLGSWLRDGNRGYIDNLTSEEDRASLVRRPDPRCRFV